MTYTLSLGDRAYSSWSLRGWLLFEKFNLPVTTEFGWLYTDHFHSDLATNFGPARTVPAVRFDDGTSIGDSLAIAEELNDRHPEAEMWPTDPAARALARMLACEMHSSYMALREHCPMNIRVAYAHCAPTDHVVADVKRIEIMWGLARSRYGAAGPWLFGTYSIADVMFAPVAARIAGYGIPVSDNAQQYVMTHLNDVAFRKWRALSLVSGPDQTVYRREYPVVDWPVQPTIQAKATDNTNAENALCPYSGKPPAHFGTFNGRIFGFCNPVCRDKTVADPTAWPKFMDMFSA